MGVKETWKLLEPHQHKTSVEMLKREGLTHLFIDGGVLLHRAIIYNPNDAKPGADLTSFVQWCLETLHGLVLFGLTPVVVFDGASPASKNTTKAIRTRSCGCTGNCCSTR